MNKKICLFLPNLCIGGAERTAVNIANGLCDRGYDIDVILSKAKGEYIPSLKNNINLIDLNKNKVSQSVIDLSKYIENTKPTAIISFMDHCNSIAIVANIIAKSKTKTIATIHSTISQRKFSIKNKLIIVLQRYLYKYVNKIIVVSKEAGEDVRKVLNINKDKCVVIYNPIITKEMIFKSKERINHKWINNNEYFNIIGVGRLTEEKGFDDLIKAFYKVNKKHKNSRLIILGEGLERDKLESLVAELGLCEYVDMPGYMNPYPYMRLSDLFILSSKREGLPSALIEAMACGTKVISTTCKSGPKEILLNGKLGKLVEVGNVEEMADAIQNVMRETLIKVEYDSLERFEENHILDKYVELILNNKNTIIDE